MFPAVFGCSELVAHSNCIYRRILTLFPNIKYDISSPKAKSQSRDEVVDTRWFNSQVVMQRGLREIRSRISEKSSQDEADTFIPASFASDLYG